MFRADGRTGLEELLDGLVVLFVGVHLGLCRYDPGNVSRGNLGDLYAEFVFCLYEVHQRVALVDDVAFLDPDAVDFTGYREPDFRLLDGLGDAVKTAGSRKRRPSRNEKCCFDTVVHGALVVEGGFFFFVFFFIPCGIGAGGVARHDQFRTEDEGVHVCPVVGVDGDVHAHGIAAVPLDEDVFLHLDKQRVLVYPRVGVSVVAVRVDGAVHSAGVVPLDTVGILGQFLGELDPDGIFDAEGCLEVLVAGPGVARDGVYAAAGLECGVARKVDIDAFAGFLSVGDDFYGNQGGRGEGDIVVQEQGVLVDLGLDGQCGCIGSDGDGEVAGTDLLVEYVVRDFQLGYVLEALVVLVHDV